ncbi:MAG: hypothetical protein K2M10_09990, partial [Muribaculaceae bacterium]|nr:hypothetical protein [Muribaculaceae bacterium]
MLLKEADGLFVTPARRAALEAMLADKKIRRIRLAGLKGSAAALLFAALPERKAPYLIVADDMDAAGYIYHDICQTVGEERVA